ARLTSASYINGGLIHDGTYFFTRAATNAQTGVHMWAFDRDHFHAVHDACLRNTRTRRDLYFFEPNRLGRGGTKLFTHSARRGHGPGQAAPSIEHSCTNADRFLTDPQFLRFFNFGDGARWTYLSAQHTRMLTIPDPRNQDGGPCSFRPRLKKRRM